LASKKRGVKAHIIIYQQKPLKLAQVLPPPIKDIISPVCVLFVSTSLPAIEWLREHAKPLAFNAKRVRSALQWLKVHNPLYKDITLNEPCVQQLETNPVLPFSIEHIRPNAANETATSRYGSTPTPDESLQKNESAATIPFQNVSAVITDVDCHASSNELRAAALRHVKKKGGSYIKIPHDRSSANEFAKNSLLFPMIYPSLFPYGIGGLEDVKRSATLSLKRHVKHLLHLPDRRFQEHPSFMFPACNII
ncbi:hypothetical protein DFH09DRAFT_949299, partial [Mycena vulgaris]